VSLASKAAEQLFLGSEWTGQFGDLPAATRAATMYMLCGMGGGSLYAPHAFGPINPDGEMKHAIERLLDEQYKKVKVLLGANRETVTAIAEALLIREELDGDEVAEIMDEVEDRIARRACACAIATPACASLMRVCADAACARVARTARAWDVAQRWQSACSYSLPCLCCPRCCSSSRQVVTTHLPCISMLSLGHFAGIQASGSRCCSWV